MVLLCGKTFPRETKHTHLFSPERDPIIDQRKGTTKVESGETMIFLGLLTGVGMRGCLEEQERLKNNSYITKAHPSVGDSSQKAKPGATAQPEASSTYPAVPFPSDSGGLSLFPTALLLSAFSRQLVLSQSLLGGLTCLRETQSSFMAYSGKA